MLSKIYSEMHNPKSNKIRSHELALLFMVFAMGALFRLELPPHDPIATEYLMLSKAALVKSNFMVNSTIHCVQTLVSVTPVLWR